MIMNKLPYSLRSKLPPVPGVYYVSSGEVLLYVGASSNIKQRFEKKHSHQDLFYRHKVDSIGWMETPDYARLELPETIRLKPILNKYNSCGFRRYTAHTIFEGPWWKQLSLAI